MGERPTRLYGRPGAEYLFDDMARATGDPTDDGTYQIEEWTVRPAIEHLPAWGPLYEWVCQEIVECGEVSDAVEMPSWLEVPPEVIAKIDAALESIADLMDGCMAGDLVATYTVEVKGGRHVVRQREDARRAAIDVEPRP